MDKVFELLIGKFANIFHSCKDMFDELVGASLISFVKANDKDNIIITLTKPLESDVVDRFTKSITHEDSSFQLWYNSNQYDDGSKRKANSGTELNPQLTICAKSTDIGALLSKLESFSIDDRPFTVPRDLGDLDSND